MLKQVEFIKLEKPERAHLLCELAEEFYLKGERVLVMVQDDNQGVSLDRFMWVWKKDSFVPHIYDNGSVEGYDEPVVIVTHEDNPNGARVLIQGRQCDLDFVAKFAHTIEFAELYNAESTEHARERFRSYRELGIEPTMRK